MTGVLIVAVFALAGLCLACHLRGKRLPVPVVTLKSAALREQPDAVPPPRVNGMVDGITDEALSLEYARRVKEKADLIKTQELLKNLHEIALAQFTPVPSALPSEVNHHPAAKPKVPNP